MNEAQKLYTGLVLTGVAVAIIADGRYAKHEEKTTQEVVGRIVDVSAIGAGVGMGITLTLLLARELFKQ